MSLHIADNVLTNIPQKLAEQVESFMLDYQAVELAVCEKYGSVFFLELGTDEHEADPLYHLFIEWMDTEEDNNMKFEPFCFPKLTWQPDKRAKLIAHKLKKNTAVLKRWQKKLSKVQS